MKAPTLLEAIKAVQADAVRQPVVGKSAIAAVNARYRERVDRLILFYSMPFTPDMLTGEKAIFGPFTFDEDGSEKWNGHDEYRKRRYYTKGYGLTFDGGLTYDYHEVSHTEEGTEHDDIDVEIATCEPKTIAQFISDCTRAGIPLTFTPYGEKLWRGEQ